MTTLLALYRRPDGGDEGLRAFERGYTERHLPLVARTPGLRSLDVHRVRRSLTGQTDVVVVAAMRFDSWDALKAGLASEPMRAAGETLEEIAPGLATLLVLDEAPDLVPSGTVRP